MDSPDRCMTALHVEEVETDGPGFRALGSDAMGDRLLGILRHQALGLGLGLFVFEVSYRVRAKCKRIPARRWSRSYR